MATDFIMPRMGDAVRSGNFQPYGAQQLPTTRQHPFPPPASAFQPQPPQAQQHTPDISPLSTSTSSSPQSPKSFHARQLRPLYMPAVLRPTEFHSKPPTPPRSKPDDDADDDTKPRSSGSFISLPGLGKINISHLRRRSTGDSGKSLSGSLKLDEFPEVKGLPSRNHWKADSSSTICDEPTCQKYFSYFTRRHHCRRCGNIFCDAHSSYEVPLDEHVNYNPRAEPSRSCSHCFHEFKLWRSRTSSQASSTSDDGSQSTPHAATAPASPITSAASSIASPHGVPTAATSATNSNKADIAQSVPRDWHWSTF